MIQSPKQWRSRCNDGAYPLRLITDYNNLEYFVPKKYLNCRYAWWLEFLCRFDYLILYGPRKSSWNADASTRRPGDLPEMGDERLKTVEQVVLKPQNLLEQLGLLAYTPPVQNCPSISDLVSALRSTNLRRANIWEAIWTNSGLKVVAVVECLEEEGRICYRGSLYIQESDTSHWCIIHEHCDLAFTGPQGPVKPVYLLSQGYYWKEMCRDVNQYIWNCHSCQWARSSQDLTWEISDLCPFEINYGRILWRTLWYCYQSVKGLMRFGWQWIDFQKDDTVSPAVQR